MLILETLVQSRLKRMRRHLLQQLTTTFLQTPAPAEHDADPGEHKKKLKKKKRRADASEAIVICKLQD